VLSSEAQRRGHVRRMDAAGHPLGVVVGVEGSGRVSVVAAQMGAQVHEDFARAKHGVGRSDMRDHFAFDSILLVGEREGGPHVAVHVNVIQRSVSGRNGRAIDFQGDVTEVKGL
jgi:hypothetical protein